MSEKGCLGCGSYFSIWILGFDSTHITHIEFPAACHLPTLFLERRYNIWWLLFSPFKHKLSKNKSSCSLFLKNLLQNFRKIMKEALGHRVGQFDYSKPRIRQQTPLLPIFLPFTKPLKHSYLLCWQC